MEQAAPACRAWESPPHKVEDYHHHNQIQILQENIVDFI